MPTMLPSVLALLVDRLDDPAIDAVVLEHGWPGSPAARRRADAHRRRSRPSGWSQPASGACGRSTRRSSTAVIDEATWRAIDPDGRTLRDIDTPADLP